MSSRGKRFAFGKTALKRLDSEERKDAPDSEVVQSMIDNGFAPYFVEQKDLLSPPSTDRD